MKAYITRLPTLTEDTNDAEHTFIDGESHDVPVQCNNHVQEHNVHSHHTHKELLRSRFTIIVYLPADSP